MAAETERKADAASYDTDIVWGAEAIGREIGQTARQAFYLLERKHIPGRKVGGKWSASRSALRAFFAPKTETA